MDLLARSWVIFEPSAMETGVIFRIRKRFVGLIEMRQYSVHAERLGKSTVSENGIERAALAIKCYTTGLLSRK